MTKDSRLERFLKALCSLDYSDLPTPLSRVEVLWSCLVTGETAPDFQPQSRTEKYLMSILGVYDLEGIPQPISKAEMLLYKLATGDTNVELGGGAKSRYEELLAEIVGKGEIGYTDFYYTTHTLTESLNTLYNTAEAPVKSAILKGNTKLVDEMGNICDELNTPNTIRGAYISEDTGQEILAEASFNTSFIKCPTVSFSVIGENRYKRVIFFDKNKEFILGLNSPYDDNKTFTVAMSEIPTNAIYMRISASLSLKDGVTYKPNQKIFIEDTNGNNLYLTNLSSVKMPVLKTTGKNLANLTKLKPQSYVIIHNQTHNEILWEISSWGDWHLYSQPIYVGKGAIITMGATRMIDCNINVHNYSTDEVITTIDKTMLKTTIESPSDYIYFDFMANDVKQECNISEFRVNVGNTLQPYEPFKSNILTVNEPVELRGIGDVKDELNLLTGEVTQRIHEVILDGNTLWNYGKTESGWNQEGEAKAFYSQLATHNKLFANKKINGISVTDKMETVNGINIVASKCNTDCFGLGHSNYVIIRKTGVSTPEELQQWLSENPITVQYELETESVKTVDLSILNQDDKPTKLKTFDDITYVDISSDGLLPELETTVLTKNLEQLSTMGLRMNDILDDQERIEGDNNTLNNDLESTMLATTEIYEDIL